MVERVEPVGVELWRRTVRRLTWSAVVANGLGAITVFLLLGLLLPFSPTDRHLVLNGVVGVVYLPLALFAGTVWARRRGRSVDRWIEEGRVPTAEERRLVLAEPMDTAVISGFFWVVAAVLFTALNLPGSGWSALIVGGALLLGGETTAAVGYLLAERIIRPITVLALAGAAPPERCGPGVSGRLAMAWSLGTGIPLLGILTIATAGLVDPNESPELLAASIAFLAGVGLLVGSFAITVASRSVAEPVAAVRRAMAQVQEGLYETRVPVDDTTEVGLLEAGFNSMAAGLEERERLRDLFGRHVGREVAEAALAREGEIELGGELREVAVVFVDVIDSTGLAMRRRPHEVVELLNRFFEIVVETIEEHCGWVNKFEGDGAVCVFGAPSDRPDAAGDALRAARALHARLTGALEGISAGIGVSAGPAVAGNIGAEERFEYTVIGDPVNEAARLSEFAKQRPERLLASHAVLRRADPAEAALWEARDAIVLRGRDEPTQVAVPRARLTAVS
jgi:adenylate cyclase